MAEQLENPGQALRMGLKELFTAALRMDLGTYQTWHRWLTLNFSKENIEKEALEVLKHLEG